MRITIQTGIDARQFQALMYDFATAGADTQARAEHKKQLERLKLLPKLAPAQGQRGLFDEEEGTR